MPGEAVVGDGRVRRLGRPGAEVAERVVAGQRVGHVRSPCPTQRGYVAQMVGIGVQVSSAGDTRC